MKTFPNFRTQWWTLTTLAIMMILATSLQAQRAENQPAKVQKEVNVRPGKQATKVAPFSRTAARANVDKYVSTATFLNLDAEAMKPVQKERPRFLEMTVPGPDGKDLQLSLELAQPMEAEAKVFTPQGEVKYEQNLHYRGKVLDRNSRGNAGSMAAVSISDGELAAVISTEKEGNLVLGRVGNRTDAGNADSYIFYREKDLTQTNPMTCGTDDHEDNLKSQIAQTAEANRGSTAGRVVRVYVEVDNTLFNNLGGSVGAAVNYVNALFNVTAMIYERENVKTQISQVFVWTSPDPYRSSSTAAALDDFRGRIAALGSFNGDLAHLMSGDNSGGGRGYIGVLCFPNISYRTAYSGNLGTSFNFFPTYSWETMVVTHEMGHNLGSEHTQWCGWPGGAIDNCVSPEGACSPGPTPLNGGTIMSYCHLSSAGMNFNHGFGFHPGNTIRSSVSGAACLTTANLSCYYAEDIVPGVKVSGTTVGAADVVNYYSSIWWPETGPEKVYRLITTEPGTITATLTNTSADVDVFILEACSESSSLAHGNNQAFTGTVPKGEYYIVVDGYNGAAGSFDLLVEASGHCFTVGNSDYEYIQRVQFGAYSNTTGSNVGYGDFTEDRIVFKKGVDKSVVLTPGYAGTAYNENWRIWMDKDSDKILGESGEEIFAAGPTNAVVNDVINIPHGSLFTGGQFGRMRVQMNYSAPFEPCGEIGFGEVEDYSFYLDDYCLSYGTNGEEWIGGVSMGSLSHVSGRAPNGYGNHAGKTGFLQKGVPIGFKLVPAYSGGNYPEAWRVWIDLNNNYEFEADELVIDLGAAVGAQTGSFTLDNSHTNGWKRMRVQMKYSSASSACADFTYGEVEDYTVYVDDYCDARGDGGFDYIGLVQLGTIVKPSFLSGGYSDFTSFVSDAPIGGAVSFSLDPDFFFLFGSATPQAWSIFADFNRDFDFDDDGETLVRLSASAAAQSGNISIPLNATAGPVRVRIMMKRDASAGSPCLTDFDGETQDFTLNLVPVCDAPTGLFALAQSNTTATVGVSEQSGVMSYNFRFRLQGTVAWNTVESTEPSIDITGLTAGKTYEVQTQTTCPDGSAFAWSASKFWKQPGLNGPCGLATALNVREVGTTNAQTIWNFVNGASAYRVQYLEAGTAFWIQIETSTPSLELTELTPNKRYYWKVAVQCGDTWGAFREGPVFYTLPSLSLLGSDDRSAKNKVVVQFQNEEEMQSISNMTAMPNPFNDELTVAVQSENVGKATVSVVNLTGQVIENQEIEIVEGAVEIPFQTTDWAAGIYFVRLQIGADFQTLKVVKQ